MRVWQIIGCQNRTRRVEEDTLCLGRAVCVSAGGPSKWGRLYLSTPLLLASPPPKNCKKLKISH